MNLPQQVTVVEVGPRDGLQNESAPISVEQRVALIEALAAAGLPVIESGSFVSPKWVPQMADSDKVLQQLHRRAGTRYTALTPNMRGFEGALAASADEVAIFGAASEAFSQKNINCSIDESLARFAEVATAARTHNIPLRGYASCVLGCPYEGHVEPRAVQDLCHKLLDMGCYEVSLGDTIGVGSPGSMQGLLDVLLEDIPARRLAVHCHDTYGQALANILVALQHGIATVDAAVAGLGGCPYAAGASGNVSTEDVVYMLQGLDITTGIDLAALCAAGRQICQQLGRENGSRVSHALQGSSAA